MQTFVMVAVGLLAAWWLSAPVEDAGAHELAIDPGDNDPGEDIGD